MGKIVIFFALVSLSMVCGRQLETPQALRSKEAKEVTLLTASIQTTSSSTQLAELKPGGTYHVPRVGKFQLVEKIESARHVQKVTITLYGEGETQGKEFLLQKIGEAPDPEPDYIQITFGTTFTLEKAGTFVDSKVVVTIVMDFGTEVQTFTGPWTFIVEYIK